MGAVVAPSLTPDCYTPQGQQPEEQFGCSSLSHPGLLHSQLKTRTKTRPL